MTKISLGLTALSFALLLPLAAQANVRNGAVTECALDTTACIDGPNQVGKPSVSYGLQIGNGKSEDSSKDLTNAQSGEAPIYKVVRPASKLADGHKGAPILDYDF
jgi:hypothetical protein